MKPLKEYLSLIGISEKMKSSMGPMFVLDAYLPKNHLTENI